VERKAAAEIEGGIEMNLVESLKYAFHAGGMVVMSSITAVALLSLIIIIERSYRYWLQYDLENSSGFMAAVQKMVMNNSIENAIRLCKKARPKLLPYVLAEGLKRANDSTEEIENAMEHATLSAVPQVTKWVAFLGTTANVATLLGLLGTIFGLKSSFAAVATKTGAAKNEALAEGIAEALTATSYGLAVAMLCLIAYGILMLKQGAIVDNLNKNSARLVDLLFTRKMKIKGTVAK
jgi:biopolymer transport protein ExbB